MGFADAVGCVVILSAKVTTKYIAHHMLALVGFSPFD